MKYLADLHIHTVASGHAYSTVDEIVREAREKELIVVGIADHSDGMPGGAPLFHFHNLRAIPREIYGVTVLKGAEVNIVDYEGGLDLSESTLAGLDFAIASLHPPCIEFAEANEVTKGLIKVMENPHIKIIGHPGDARYPFDVEAIVLASKRTGTLLEVNNASLTSGSFRPGVRECLVKLLEFCKIHEVPIIVGTDAHICYAVGDFELSKNLLEEVDFPQHLIMNTMPDKLVEFVLRSKLK
ncbi:MAG: phosphatase [Cellulosilyticaceae bacterium]